MTTINDTAIQVTNIGKTYEVWSNPKDRLYAFLLKNASRIIRLSGLKRLSEKLDENAASRYKEFHALRNVSFSVKKGEAVGIVGFNGSGKSTLLQIIAGVLRPSIGNFVTNGRVAALLELGAGFSGDFTGRENIYLNGAILGIPKKEMDKRFEAIADFAEIGDFIDRPVKTYSSGMSVRLAFSVLTQIDPDVLIIDEALSVGDAYFSHKCAQKIRDFRNQGKTMLFVSHDPGAVKSLCNRAILLENGIVIKQGPAEAVLDYYNAIVAKKEKDNEIRQIESETGRTITRSGNRKAEIQNITLTNHKGQEARGFISGERATLKARVTFNENSQQPTFGILIRDRLGADVFGTNTFHSGNAITTKSKGDISNVIVDFQLNLGPGNYSITLAVHSGLEHTEESFDWIDHALVIEILPPTGKHFIGTAAIPCSIEWI